MAMPEKSIFLNVHTESEVKIEEIKTEICAGANARAFIDSISGLLFLAVFQTKYTEREIEADVFHDENANAGAEVERNFIDACMSVFRFSVIDTRKIGRTVGERQIHFIENCESLATIQAEVIAIAYGAGISGLNILHIGEMEVHIVGDVHSERTDGGCGVAVNHLEAYTLVMIEKVADGGLD